MKLIPLTPELAALYADALTPGAVSNRVVNNYRCIEDKQQVLRVTSGYQGVVETVTLRVLCPTDRIDGTTEVKYYMHPDRVWLEQELVGGIWKDRRMIRPIQQAPPKPDVFKMVADGVPVEQIMAAMNQWNILRAQGASMVPDPNRVDWTTGGRNKRILDVTPA